MRVNKISNINFQRRLKPSEEAEYCEVLSKAHGVGKKVLIVPATSLPNETGVGNLGTKESLEFFDFAKKYWGINEVQILPMGQYHEHKREYPMYSGTSIELGNHVINIKNYVSDEDYQKIIQNNSEKNHVNFANIIKRESTQEKILKELFQSGKFQKEFEKFKTENHARLESKALYNVLREINGTHDYKKWNDLDKNLFNEDIVKSSERIKRIQEIKNLKSKEIDFYYFKQFLAEDSFKNAKKELNSRGLKLSGDMLCGFSYDEVWANPKAFHQNTSIGWGLPALNFDVPEGEKLLREKVKFYAEHYDGIRVDAAWTYANQPLIQNGICEHKYYGEKILDIIDDEVKKVKGENFDTKNIMHEFATSHENFSIYDGEKLRPYIDKRMKIYTSNYLSDEWGSNKNFLKRGWNPDSFIIGTSNHDSKAMKYSETQAEELSKILKIQKPTSQKEFVQAKFAEPIGAKNNMLYFIDALNLNSQFLHNKNRELNYTAQIPKNYQEHYFKSLENGEGFNPMGALQKSFKAKELDRQEPELYKKIVKFQKILKQKENSKKMYIKWGVTTIACGALIYSLIRNFPKYKSQLFTKKPI